VGVGSRWTQVVRIMGMEQTMDAEIIDFRPPTYGAVRLTGPGSPVVTTSVEAADSGSLLTQSIDIQVPPGIAGLTIQLGLPHITEQLHESIRRQKIAAEKAVRE